SSAHRLPTRWKIHGWWRYVTAGCSLSNTRTRAAIRRGMYGDASSALGNAPTWTGPATSTTTLARLADSGPFSTACLGGAPRVPAGDLTTVQRLEPWPQPSALLHRIRAARREGTAGANRVDRGRACSGRCIELLGGVRVAGGCHDQVGGPRLHNPPGVDDRHALAHGRGNGRVACHQDQCSRIQE